MDFTYFKNGEIKIKAKSLGIIVDSSSKITISESDKAISGPGEYEIKGVSVLGFGLSENTVYLIEVDRLKIGVVEIGDKKLNTELVDELGAIDVLITDSPTAVSDIEPYFVIPVATNSEEFIKAVGLQSEKSDKFTIKKEEIIEDQNTKIIVLEAK